MKRRVLGAVALALAFFCTAPAALASPAGVDHMTSPWSPFVGVNVYPLANDYGVNEACGPNFAGQWDGFFSSLPRDTVVRFWAFEATATSATNPKRITWSPLDSVFRAAARHDIRLIPVLGNEWGTTCTGQSLTDKDLTWFSGGYKSDSDEGPLPYWQWVREIVTRYSSSPALYMWEPINEPQDANADISCSESLAEPALYSFFGAVGGRIHSLDRRHPVEAGLLGTGSCGTVYKDYQAIGASPGIDVLSYHDYYPADVALGGDPYNGIAVHVSQAKALGKPIISGEVGIQAGDGCSVGLQQRAGDFQARIQAQGQAGTEGFLLWNLVASPFNCTYDIGPGDPSLQLVNVIRTK